MAKFNFTDKDLKKIESAVKQAESQTTGEIAISFTKESDNYAVYELMFALVCGFFTFLLMLFFASTVEEFIKNMFWDKTPYYLVMVYGFSSFLVIAIAYFIANISVIDRLIVPKSIMRRKVGERAIRHFMESGVYKTQDRTGILIFISALERRVELLADTGINKKIAQEKWDGIIENIIQGIKKNTMVESIITSIQECGLLLKEHFPVSPEDQNELRNGMKILEK